jgi:hypothetical protein
MKPFTSSQTVKLTSTTSSQTVVVPNGFNSLSIYNAGANPVYFALGASVAVPTVGTWVPGVIAVQPSTTQVFATVPMGGTFAYIAETAGGTVVVSVGEGM